MERLWPLSAALGLELSAPPTWHLFTRSPPRASHVAYDNFSGDYITGGPLPPGGAAINIVREPLPEEGLTALIARESAHDVIVSNSAVTVGGENGTRIVFQHDMLFGQHSEAGVAVYVPRGGFRSMHRRPIACGLVFVLAAVSP
jgi:hypothetical protein